MKRIMFSMLALVIVVAASLTGCSSEKQGASSHRVLDKSTYASAQPSDFDGPYANDIATVIVGSSNMNNPDSNADYLYSVLQDSKITDQEFQETQNKFAQCMTGRGFSTKFGGPDVLGSYVVVVSDDFIYGKTPYPPGEMEADTFCELQTGYENIAMLYYKMLWNPEKEDLSSYSAQCLYKLGYEKTILTPEEYKDHWGTSVSGIFTGLPGNKNDIPGAHGGSMYDPNRGKNQGDHMLTKEEIEAQINVPASDFNKCNLNPKSVLSEK